MASNFHRHATAIVESDMVGDGTYVWAYAHIMPDVEIGASCNICDNVFIEGGVRVGRGVTIKNGVCLWQGVTVEDDVFIGPNAAFTNDRRPRSSRAPTALQHRGGDQWLERTELRKGCSIGANATIMCGLSIGRYAMVAAGAVVVKEVPDYALVVGVPARPVGYVCPCGIRVEAPGDFCSDACAALAPSKDA